MITKNNYICLGKIKIKIMKNIFHSIGGFFEQIFTVVESIENIINYFYIGVIGAFLILWTMQMFKHKKNNEEHAKS